MIKKVLFMLNNMNVGGTEKAFLNMIEEIDRKKYDITLLLLDKSGGFLSQVPSDVKIISVKNYNDVEPLIKLPPVESAKWLIHKNKVFKAFELIANHLICKIKKDRTDYWNFVYKDLDLDLPEFDIAVAYAGPYDLISTCILNCKAKTKVQWIHFDVSKIGFDKGFAKSNYRKFDKIYVVSDYARKKLISLVLDIEDITETKHNVISTSLCLSMANSFQAFDAPFDGIRILTVGRLSKEKGQNIIPSVVERLVAEGYSFKWYLIGDGALYAPIEQQIKEKNLCDYLVLLGTKTNPYPFFKDCDLYVQTSLHEGYCITIAEALAFDKFVITTDVAGAHDQIKDKTQGVICACNEQSIFSEIKNYLSENECKNKGISNGK